MKPTLFILLFTITTFIASAQESNKADTSQIFLAVEKQPEFPGGNEKFALYLQQNIMYPPDALKKRTQGKVFVTFVVEKDGMLSNIAIARSVSEDIDAEAVRVIKNSPRWEPGIQNGLAVRAQFTMPLSFRLPPPDTTTRTSQTDTSYGNHPDINKVFAAVEKEPEFNGGMEAFYHYLQRNIRYPDKAKTDHMQGKVFLTFVVERDGALTGIRVVRSSNSDDLDTEAIRVIKNSPNWIPGMQNNRPVRVQYTMPISFTLEGN